MYVSTPCFICAWYMHAVSHLRCCTILYRWRVGVSPFVPSPFCHFFSDLLSSSHRVIDQFTECLNLCNIHQTKRIRVNSMEKNNGAVTPNWKSVRVGHTNHESQPKTASSNSRSEWTKDIEQPKIRVVTDPSRMPLATRLSDTIPRREFSQPVDGYKEFRKVNSKMGAKATNPEGMPKYIGSSFTHIVNAPTRTPIAPPVHVSIPRPYPVLAASAQSSQAPFINNRTMTGQMLGSHARNFVPEQHVPYLPPDEPVSASNPVKALNATWSACWDKEAGATYYYNQDTGEATWIPPDL